MTLIGRREKVEQARDNPFGWDAYVIVCAFSAAGHSIRFSNHPIKETEHGESEEVGRSPVRSNRC